MNQDQIYRQVQEHYGSAAGTTAIEYGTTVAKSFGYSEEELASIPKEANLGLSCGNPSAIASLRKGETVIDLGSGAGFDVFLAAKKVGETGRAIGVDMNKAMLARANKNKANYDTKNVEFVESHITDIALKAGTADCIISNCVVNLVPEGDKPLVFKEMFRLLKLGGRVAISDILAKKPLPDEMRANMALYCGCIAGASQVHEYEGYLQQAGFRDVLLADTGSDLNVYMNTDENGTKKQKDSCCGGTAPSVDTQGCCGTAEVIDLNEWAGSYKIYAVKA